MRALCLGWRFLRVVGVMYSFLRAEMRMDYEYPQLLMLIAWLGSAD